MPIVRRNLIAINPISYARRNPDKRRDTRELYIPSKKKLARFNRGRARRKSVSNLLCADDAKKRAIAAGALTRPRCITLSARSDIMTRPRPPLAPEAKKKKKKISFSRKERRKKIKPRRSANGSRGDKGQADKLDDDEEDCIFFSLALREGERETGRLRHDALFRVLYSDEKSKDVVACREGEKKAFSSRPGFFRHARANPRTTRDTAVPVLRQKRRVERESWVRS